MPDTPKSNPPPPVKVDADAARVAYDLMNTIAQAEKDSTQKKPDNSCHYYFHLFSACMQAVTGSRAETTIGLADKRHAKAAAPTTPTPAATPATP